MSIQRRIESVVSYTSSTRHQGFPDLNTLVLQCSRQLGGKVRYISTLWSSPLSSARQIYLARIYLSVLVPLLCFSFMCKFRDTSVPQFLSHFLNGHTYFFSILSAVRRTFFLFLKVWMRVHSPCSSQNKNTLTQTSFTQIVSVLLSEEKSFTWLIKIQLRRKIFQNYWQ